MIFVASTHNIKHSIEFEFNVSCENNNDSEFLSQLETPKISEKKDYDSTVLSPSNTNTTVLSPSNTNTTVLSPSNTNTTILSPSNTITTVLSPSITTTDQDDEDSYWQQGNIDFYF